MRAVVVQLDRQQRASGADGAENALGILDRLDTGHRLRHPPEDDPARLVPLERDRDDARARLELDHPELQRPTEHEGGAERRVAGEPHLGAGVEDADPCRPALLGGQDEHGFEKPISNASACIVSASSPRASVKTASWFLASGVSVKTSAKT